MRRSNGFTLVEVIISFLIVSMLSTMVFMSLSSVNLQLNRERKRTSKAFIEQGELERKVTEVEALIDKKLTLVDEKQSASDDRKVEINKELAKLQIKLNAYDPRTHRVNDQDITMYAVSVKRYNTDNKHTDNLVSWVVEGKGLIFPVPQINKFTIKKFGKPVAEFGDGDGVGMESNVVYGLNKENLFSEQYTWYTSRPGFHMVLPKDEYFEPEEKHIGSVYPVFSHSFEYIRVPGGTAPSETGSTLSEIKEDMKGKFIVAGLRATIKEGKIGPEADSNYYYVVYYPKPLNKYIGAIDASLISDFPRDKRLYEVLGMNDNLKFKENGYGEVPQIEPHGAKTGEITYKKENFDTYSRFFSFKNNSAYDLISNSALPNSYTVYVVARQNVPSSGSVMLSGNSNSSANHKFMLNFNGFKLVESRPWMSPLIHEESIGANDGKWHIIAISFNQKTINIYKDNLLKGSLRLSSDFYSVGNSLQIGKSSFGNSEYMDIAEIIIDNSIDRSSVEKMLDNLIKKYGIS